MPTKKWCPGDEPEAPSATMIGHILTGLSRKRKLALLRLLAVELAEDDEQSPSPRVDSDTPLPAARIIEMRPGTTAPWIASHVHEAGRGARRARLYRLSDVDAALAAGAQPPRPRKSRPITGVNEDPIDQLLARGELVARRGSR